MKNLKLASALLVYFFLVIVQANDKCSIAVQAEIKLVADAYFEKIKLQDSKFINEYIKKNNDPKGATDFLRDYLDNFKELPLIYNADGTTTGRRLYGVDERGYWRIEEPNGSLSLSPNGHKYSLVAKLTSINQPNPLANKEYTPQYNQLQLEYVSPSGTRAKIDPKEMAVITKDSVDRMAKSGFPRNAATMERLKTDLEFREKFFKELGNNFQDYNDTSRGLPFEKQYGQRGAKEYKQGGNVCSILASGKGVCRETSIGMNAVLADYGIKSFVRTGNSRNRKYDGRHAWLEVESPNGQLEVMNGNWGDTGYYKSADEYYRKTGYVPDSRQPIFSPK